MLPATNEPRGASGLARKGLALSLTGLKHIRVRFKEYPERQPISEK
jgi:hypothetical protein